MKEEHAVIGPSTSLVSVKSSGPGHLILDALWRNRALIFMNVPTIAFVGLVLVYPIVFSGYLSLHKVDLRSLLTGDFTFVGLANYANLFSDPLFRTVIGNTLFFTLIVVPAEIVLSVVVSLLMNKKTLRTSSFLTLIMLLPFAVPPIASGVIWSFVYNVKFGYLNRFLYNIGAIDQYVDWSGAPNLAIYAVCIAYVWRTLPLSALLVYASLQSIPKSLYEAASIDGATAWQSFWNVTLPHLRSVIVTTMILRTAFAMTVFEEVMAITNGGPGNATTTASWFIYTTSFAPPFSISTGAAASYLLAILVAVICVIYVKLANRNVEGRK